MSLEFHNLSFLYVKPGLFFPLSQITIKNCSAFPLSKPQPRILSTACLHEFSRMNVRRRCDLLLSRSSFYNCKPDKPHYSSQDNGSRRRKFEPHAPNEARRTNYNPPRLLSKGRAVLISLVDVPNLPKPVYCGIHKTYC